MKALHGPQNMHTDFMQLAPQSRWQSEWQAFGGGGGLPGAGLGGGLEAWLCLEPRASGGGGE